MRSEEIESVGVVGAGQMGVGIAEVCAAAGYAVTLSDVDEERVTRSLTALERRLHRRVEQGKLEPSAPAVLLSRIRPSSLEGHTAAQLIIEAASEDEALKLALFRSLSQIAAPDALLTSNTSSISITRIAAVVAHPDRVAGLHFMNPVPVMSLVELVRGLQTSQATLDALVAVARRLGKETVQSEDRPGFIVNRVLIPLLNEACFALSEGVASAEDLDKGVQLGLNHPLGPLALADLIGLDTVLAIARVLHRDFADSKYRPAPLLVNLVAAGHLGRKAGRGFYLYDEGARGPAALLTPAQRLQAAVLGGEPLAAERSPL